MISCGRGRSRGRAKEMEVPLRRPGENALCKNSQSVCNDIIEGINNLTINESIPIDQIIEIVQLVQTAKDEETLKSIFDKLFKRALEDKIFGIKLAKLFSDIKFSTIKVNENQNLRYLLLRTSQNYYTKREEIRKESNTLFRNVASLLGEIYYQMTLIQGYPIRVLELPLLDYWNMLLETATEEDIELAVTQVIINGKSIYERHPEELDKFMFNVRKTLVNNNLSTLAKGMLLLIIDLANQQFNSLPANVYDYYMSQLGTTVGIYLQRHEKDLASAENVDGMKSMKNLKENKKDINNKSEEGETLIVHPKEEAIPACVVPAGENCESKESAVMNINKKNFSVENTVPRAIRGPGASNTKRNFKNQSKPFTDLLPSQRTTKNIAWGHDDRFENDHE